MRPQFGSPPHQLVFTNELLATARAAASASPNDRAPETRTVTKRETPSPSRTIIFASSRQTWFSADWNKRDPPGPPLPDAVRFLASATVMGLFSARPLAS